ncbi:hypothetical protein FQN60_015630, partial [Etheostoma spectabile]
MGSVRRFKLQVVGVAQQHGFVFIRSEHHKSFDFLFSCWLFKLHCRVYGLFSDGHKVELLVKSFMFKLNKELLVMVYTKGKL